MSALLAAAERLTRRLRILQKLQAQYRDEIQRIQHNKQTLTGLIHISRG